MRFPMPLRTKEGTFLSVYSGECTKPCVIEQCSVIRAAFPELDDSFFKLFVKIVMADQVPDKKLIDAVGHVVRTCVYPKPTIGAFLSYDKTVRAYSHREMTDIA